MKCPHCTGEIQVHFTATRATTLAEIFPGVDALRVPANEAPGSGGASIEVLLGMIFDEDLTDWEKGFIGDLRERFQKYGTTLRMTEKQMARLRSIAAK